MADFFELFEHLKIQLEDIKLATNNFSDNNLLGQGGFGKVYRGSISHSKGENIVAFKRLDSRYGQGNSEFWREIMMLSRHTHENLISLLGYCDEGGEKILVYELASRGSLDNHLRDSTLTWKQRLKICIASAKGLNYLHDPKGSQQRVLHRDIKSSNILLDDNWKAKVSDMGLSKIGPANQTHSVLVTNLVGTLGYLDPQYINFGMLTKESDVYSYGAVLFEVLCGKLCCVNDIGKFENLIPIWKQSYEHKKLDEIIFQDLKQQMAPSSLATFSDVAYLCVQELRENRPTMSRVVKQLEEALKFQEIYESRIDTIDSPSGSGRLNDETEGDEGSSGAGCEIPYSVTQNELFKRTFKNWRRGEYLGRGAFTTVFKCYNELGFVFAVKEVSLLGQSSLGKQSVIQLEQEISLLSQFHHENIVRYLGTDKDYSALYIFLELVTEGSLAKLYQKYELQDFEVSAYTMQILSGLKYLHDRKVVHRDIRCANILLDSNGSVKLADFGLAKAFTLKGDIKGTQYWMAPEVVNNLSTKDCGLAADIWSLGCTVLEMLTRKIPYYHLEGIGALFRIGRGKPPEIPTTLSELARHFILCCLQVNPNDRPTAAQLLDHPFLERAMSMDSFPASPRNNSPQL